MSEIAKCGLCGEPMPEGEQMFMYHGYSGDCPKPPLQRIQKAERPEEPPEVSEMRSYTYRQAGLVVKHIDALSAYADRMAAERDAAERDRVKEWNLRREAQGTLDATKAALLTERAKLARVVEGLREPTKEMRHAGKIAFATHDSLDATFKAMSAELLRQIEGDK